VNDIDDLGFEDEANDRSARHGEPASVGPWFVRFAGRRSGPFDAERLRTLARRGALTRMHSVSADGKAWVSATSVRAVFNADGSVVASGARAVEVAEDDRPDFDEIPDAPLELPRAMARAALGSALVRPVVLCALVLATVMLAMPTSRDESGALAWWWSEGAADITVRGLCAVAVLGGWVIAFLAPEPARAASVAAVAAVLAAAASLGLLHAHWAIFAVLLVPASALLVALDAAGSAGSRTMGGASIAVAALMGIATAVTVALTPAGWSIAGAVLAVVGAGALGFAGFRAMKRPGPSAEGVFWGSVAGATGALGAAFAAAFGGLAGPQPMDGAKAAVTACLVLAFSAISWASVHEAVESSHLLPRASDDDAANEAGTEA
jgi:hypothetical protein